MIEVDETKNVFREHRGGLAESLETTIECPNGLSDIKVHYKDSILRHYIKKSNIFIERINYE